MDSDDDIISIWTVLVSWGSWSANSDDVICELDSPDVQWCEKSVPMYDGVKTSKCLPKALTVLWSAHIRESPDVQWRENLMTSLSLPPILSFLQ